MENKIITQDFFHIYSIIDIHRKRAFQEINNNSLMIAWNVGGYVSARIKSSEWGSKVVTELSEYLRTKDPNLKGYSRRSIYKMVQFYETYSTKEFTALVDKLKIQENCFLPQSSDVNSIMPFQMAQIPTLFNENKLDLSSADLK